MPQSGVLPYGGWNWPAAEPYFKGIDMKLARQVRLGAFGAAIMMFAGAAAAQTFDDIWVHGNACVGGGAVPSAYGATNSSTTNSASVTCPITAAWPAPGNIPQDRYLVMTYWNRSNVAGAFSCRAYGLDVAGNKVWDPGNYNFAVGAPNSGPVTTSLYGGNAPPLSAKYFSVSCTIPKSSGAGGGSSYISGISLRIGS
jgi:hypothetical protein